MATMKEIAELAGVSRGTVDRVLNNRGEVNKTTQDKILKIAKAVNYKPSKIGKKLAVKKKNLKFGFILYTDEFSNPFFKEVVDSIKLKEQEFKDYNVSIEIRYSSLNNPKLQEKIIDELVAQGAKGIAITPINDELIVSKIKKLSSEGFPFITVNSDLPQSGRLAYVGSDYYKSGEVAAGLLGMISGGCSKVGIIIGSNHVPCHSERVTAFEKYVKNNLPNIEVVKLVGNNDDDIKSYIETKKLLENNKEINSLFMASAGVNGACKAIKEIGLAGKIKVVGYDAHEITKLLLKEGLISATITQDPFMQGSVPLDLLFDYVGLGITPAKEIYHTEIGIKIKENL